MVLGYNNIRRFPAWMWVAVFVLFFAPVFFAFADAAPGDAEKALQGPQPKAQSSQSTDQDTQTIDQSPSSTDHSPSSIVQSPKFSGDIHISADKLISTRDDFTAEFSGNVIATQAGATIRSDRLFVHYEKSASDPSVQGKAGLGAGRIKRITAEGNVKIEMSNKTSFCDRAMYTVADGLITLSGKDVRISDEDNYIHGRQITLNLLTGEINVSGGPKKRVEAVFNPRTEKMPDISLPQKQD